MAVGKKPIQLDKNEFQNVITEIEAVNTFKSRSDLWKFIANTDWAQTRVPRPLTAQVALLKAEEFKLEIKTPKGKRGCSKGENRFAGGIKKKKVFSIDAIVAGIPKEQQELLAPIIEKCKSGSLKARIKLKCLDCCNWEKGEVRKCEMVDCSLHDVRPYKPRDSVKELEVVSL